MQLNLTERVVVKVLLARLVVVKVRPSRIEQLVADAA